MPFGFTGSSPVLPTTFMEEKEKQERVYQLTKELEETKRRKKDVARAWTNEIRRLQDEIKHIINPPELDEELP